MKVNPSQSQPIWSDPSHSAGKAKASQSSQIEQIDAIEPSKMHSEAFSSDDAKKMHEMVKGLMQESAVRSEVVDNYDRSGPVKAFDEETLRRFVSALSEEP